MVGFRDIGRGIGRLTKNRGSVVVLTCRGASTTRSGVGESKVGRKARITFYKFELEFFSHSKRLLLRVFALLAELGQYVKLSYLDFSHLFDVFRFPRRQCANSWFPA